MILCDRCGAKEAQHVTVWVSISRRDGAGYVTDGDPSEEGRGRGVNKDLCLKCIKLYEDTARDFIKPLTREGRMA